MQHCNRQTHRPQHSSTPFHPKTGDTASPPPIPPNLSSWFAVARISLKPLGTKTSQRHQSKVLFPLSLSLSLLSRISLLSNSPSEPTSPKDPNQILGFLICFTLSLSLSLLHTQKNTRRESSGTTLSQRPESNSWFISVSLSRSTKVTLTRTQSCHDLPLG